MIGIVIYPKITESWPKETLLCKDKKLHIRLRTYNKPEIISGLINKLTFLITYKIKAYGNVEEIFDDYEIKELISNLSYRIPDCKGIKILNEYSKLNPDSKLGAIKNSYRVSCDSSFTGLLASFQETISFPLDIQEILFNDNISIILSDESLTNEKIYMKFANKMFRQYNKKETTNINLVDLWGDKNGNN